jgi:hypothetical protein
LAEVHSGRVFNGQSVTGGGWWSWGHHTLCKKHLVSGDEHGCGEGKGEEVRLVVSDLEVKTFRECSNKQFNVDREVGDMVENKTRK